MPLAPALAPLVAVAVAVAGEPAPPPEPPALEVEVAIDDAPPSDHMSEETGVAPAPAAAPEDVPVFALTPLPPPPEPPPPVAPGPHFVLANYYGVTAGVSPFPSHDQTLFLGRALRARAPGARRVAVGYSFTASFGLAERYALGLVTTRHHVTANLYGGRRERLFAAFGGGAALFAVYVPAVIEAEARVGYVFGRPRERRTVGVVGALARLGWDVRHREYAPMPQLGIFIGLVLR